MNCLKIFVEKKKYFYEIKKKQQQQKKNYKDTKTAANNHTNTRTCSSRYSKGSQLALSLGNIWRFKTKFRKHCIKSISKKNSTTI